MSLVKLREQLDYRGICAFDVYRRAVNEYSQSTSQKLSWAEVIFLLETCDNQAARNLRFMHIEKLLAIFPPNWEALLDFTYETIKSDDERRVFISFVLAAMEKNISKADRSKIAISTAVLSDILALMPPNTRPSFALQFMSFSVCGTREELTRHLSWSFAQEFNLNVQPPGRPSRVMSIEYREQLACLRNWAVARELNSNVPPPGRPSPVISIEQRLLHDCTVKDQEATEGQKECSICMSNVARVSPQCGHKCLCVGCTQALDKRSCPICRAKIEIAIVVFD